MTGDRLRKKPRHAKLVIRTVALRFSLHLFTQPLIPPTAPHARTSHAQVSAPRAARLSEETDVRMITVVGGGIASVFHQSPVGPGGRGLAALDVPDALAPDDVFDAEGAGVVHGPFGDRAADGVVNLVIIGQNTFVT